MTKFEKKKKKWAQAYKDAGNLNILKATKDKFLQASQLLEVMPDEWLENNHKNFEEDFNLIQRLLRQ